MVNIRRPIVSSKRRGILDRMRGMRRNPVFLVAIVLGVAFCTKKCIVLVLAFCSKEWAPSIDTLNQAESLLDDGSKHIQRTSQEAFVHDVITVPLVIYDDKSKAKDSITIATNPVTSNPVRQLSIKEMMKPEHQKALTKPLLLTGWTEYHPQNQDFSAFMQEENFIKEFGNYTQYVKNQFVQPLKDKEDRKCLSTASSIVKLMKTTAKSLKFTAATTRTSKEEVVGEDNLLFFTNDLESPDLFRALKTKYTIPLPLHYDAGDSTGESFHVFSAMVQGSFHGFHKHNEAHIYQIHGRKMWWFLPPDTLQPSKENPCLFLTNNELLNENALSVLQQPGDTIQVPKHWWHATCALDDWTTAVGMQRGSPANYQHQKFEPLPQPFVKRNGKHIFSGSEHTVDQSIHPMPWAGGNAFHQRMEECGVKFDWNDPSSWTWFNGDLNEYYNKLIASDSKRNPNEIKTYAVHRWMGKDRSTLVHYEVMYGMIQHYMDNSEHRKLNLLDAGCGLGAGLMWFETNAPKSWTLTGHTISTAQLDFIQKLPSHNFNAVLKSYDDLDVYKEANTPFDVIYSIEAFVHSPNERHTLKAWAEALADEGIIVIIDDFLSVGVDKEADDIQLYAKSWMSNVLQTTSSLADIAEKFGLELIADRDLGSEYQVVKRNYQNKVPDIRPTGKKNHQGWLGSGMRQRLTVEGKLTYRMVVFQKKGGMKSTSKSTSAGLSQVAQGQCTSVASAHEGEPLLDFQPLEAEHRTGKGNDGGGKQKCISGWYCCGMGEEWLDNLQSKRTHNTNYLKLDKSLFGNYMEKMVEHLNAFYRKLPSGARGKFLDIGGTGRYVQSCTIFISLETIPTHTHMYG